MPARGLSLSARGRAGAGWRFVRGVSRGLRAGAFFPPGGRRPGAQAPAAKTSLVVKGLAKGVSATIVLRLNTPISPALSMQK